MSVDSNYLIARDGLKLYYRYWIPENPKKIICIIHGLAEHSGRYSKFANYLMDHGIGTYCMDLRGHGKSDGKRGHAKNQDILLSDIEELLKAARVQHLELPLFLMGHSMGGNLVANFMISKDSNETRGFILSSPWLKLKYEPPQLKLKIGLIIGRFWPSFSTKSGLDTSRLSRIKSEIEKYIEDPLIHSQISVSLFRLILDGGIEAIEKGESVKKPGLIYHGTDDEITDWKASEEFAATNKKLKWEALNGVYHEPHNDEGREEVYKLVKDWLLMQS